MTTDDLIAQIREDNRRAATAFISAKPPHPDELEALDETRRFPACGKSNYDDILIERSRHPQGNHVSQTVSATGVIIQGPDPADMLKVLLGTWAREDFPRKSPDGPEMV